MSAACAVIEIKCVVPMHIAGCMNQDHGDSTPATIHRHTMKHDMGESISQRPGAQYGNCPCELANHSPSRLLDHYRDEIHKMMQFSRVAGFWNGAIA